jgi:hypothetical protein
MEQNAMTSHPDLVHIWPVEAQVVAVVCEGPHFLAAVVVADADDRHLGRLDQLHQLCTNQPILFECIALKLGWVHRSRLFGTVFGA